MAAQTALPTGPTAAAGVALASRIGATLDGLTQEFNALDAMKWHASGDERQASSDAQISILKNLKDAEPGLLASFRATPGDLGAAFRLYRDLNALFLVAQRTAEAAQKYDPEHATEIEASVDGLQTDLNDLGAYIEANGTAEYAALQKKGGG